MQRSHRSHIAINGGFSIQLYHFFSLSAMGGPLPCFSSWMFAIILHY